MFTYKPVGSLRAVLVSTVITRKKGSITDPVQQLFIDKIKEYKAKSKNDNFVDPSPEILKELEKEVTKLQQAYGVGKGIDMSAFPEFRFTEPKLDPIDEEPEKKESDKVADTKKGEPAGDAEIMPNEKGKGEEVKKKPEPPKKKP